MKCRKQDHPALLAAFCLLLLAAAPAHALKSDRQQPLDVRADSTDGTLGDGTATLRGNVEIRQGTLLIRADVAAVEKAEGRVRRFELTGNPVHLQQEIEEEGLVSARARKVEYEVASGIVILTGAADVDHPQYQINGEVLRYDMNAQHFQGSGGDEDGRIRIQLDPEVVPGEAPAAAAPAAETRDPPADADSG
ncbi:MAG: lipopolysaccharide transport periplasmic protein LptA [Xanthomonadales bacterium]|jgi:lipopolysaccharide export system protein LptA|nr:lipopolysaccharide transport periplasmic protein LptA [Xanthomonadales bacterium]